MTGDAQGHGAGSGGNRLARIAAAHAARAPLQADPRQTAYRLFHGHGEGAPGLTIDRLGDVQVVTYREAYAPILDDVADLLVQLDATAPCVVAKARGGDGRPRVVRGSLPSAPPTVLDNGLRYEVEPLAPGNVGLYLDARPARAWLLEHAAERRVLNLFAYTGSLGMAASAGGASWVMHLEMQKRALRRLKQNYALNALPLDDRDVVRADLYPHLRRLARQGRMFDGIILDPPPQVPGRDARGQDYARLVPLATALLAPGGWLLCFFSSYRRTRDAYEAEILAAAPRPLDVVWRGTSGIDFPETEPDAKLRMTAFS